MGTPKQQHASNAAAVEWVLSYGLVFTGRARIYRCSSGVWHVTSMRVI